MATVVNIKHGEQYDVYIGRPSKWGNPHKMGDGVSRDDACELYSLTLWDHIREGVITIEELAELHGKRLGCYCKPLRCHGDELVKAVKWAAVQLEERSHA